MNAQAVVRSGMLGVVIGIVLALLHAADTTLAEQALTVLISGALGLAIGAVTEWATSLLPLRIARTATYFLINNAIAVVISLAVTGLLVAFSPAGFAGGSWIVLCTVVVIVCLGNLVEFLQYRRTQRRLHAAQDLLAGSGESEAGVE